MFSALRYFHGFVCWGLASLLWTTCITSSAGKEKLEVTSVPKVEPIAIIKEGKAAAVIVVPHDAPLFRKQAERIVEALAPYGTTLEIRNDTDYRDLSGLENTLILLGDRDSNLAIRKLYYLHYTLLDARYPGKGGSVLRSLHNPFGDGHDIIFAGGSDPKGVEQAVTQLIQVLSEAKFTNGNLSLGYLRHIVLGADMKPPEKGDTALCWEHTVGYGGNGYFGWNRISKTLALFYMTGESRYAHEFIRLAFPDAATAKELAQTDKEAFGNPANPLPEPYHYHAIMMILYWNLVEASPEFTDEERLNVTRKFAEQFYYYWPDRGLKNPNVFASPFRQTEPATILNDRHQLWDAVSLYAVARYFKKYYPNDDVDQALKATANVFAPFDRSVAIRIPSRSESIYWYNTQISAAFLYAALSDPLHYQGNPVVAEYARIGARLSDRTVGNPIANYSTPFFLNLAASMTNDQAFVDLIADTGQNTQGFRIGQSYWPAQPYPHNFFRETAGQLQVQQTDANLMQWKSDFPPSEVTDFISWRQNPDASGDFLLIDTKFESSRSPFHNLSIIDFRLNGHPLLNGYSTQLQLYRNGLGSAETSHFARITDRTAWEDSVLIRGQIENENHCQWSRTFLLLKNRFLLTVDELTAQEDIPLLEIHNDWRPTASTHVEKIDSDRFTILSGKVRHWLTSSLPVRAERISSRASLQSSEETLRFTVLQSLSKNEVLSFATLLSTEENDAERPEIAQEGNRIALKLPTPALLTREHDGWLLLMPDMALGFDVTEVPGIFSSDRPVTMQYDGKTHRLLVRNAGKATAKIKVATYFFRRKCSSGQTLELPLGQHTLINGDQLKADVTAVFAAKSATVKDTSTLSASAEIPKLQEEWRIEENTHIHAIEPITNLGNTLFAIAAGNRVTIVNTEGIVQQTISCAAPIGAIHWWAKPELLLITSRDEKLTAWDLHGKEIWSYTSQMAKEMLESGKFYWFKKGYPGIVALATAEGPNGQEVVFAGSASTVEILDRTGKLEGHFYQPWGMVDGFTSIPASDEQPMRMLCSRSHGGFPMLYQITSTSTGWRQNAAGDNKAFLIDRSGTDVSTYGFNAIGRSFLKAASLKSGDPLRLIGDFSGTQNRLSIWNLEGIPLHEVDLGGGDPPASINKDNYGHSVTRPIHLRGLEIVDAGDGSKKIIAALDRGYLLAFDSELNQQFSVRLDDRILTLKVIPRDQESALLVVGEVSGKISLFDLSGKMIATTYVHGLPTVLTESGNQIVIGTDQGEVVCYRIP